MESHVNVASSSIRRRCRQQWNRFRLIEHDVLEESTDEVLLSLEQLLCVLGPQDDDSDSELHDNALLWLSPEVFLMTDQATCRLWLTVSDFEYQTNYGARLLITVTERKNPNEQRQEMDSETTTHSFYLWMPLSVPENPITLPQQQERQQPVHPSASLEPIRDALDLFASWLAHWSPQTIQLQSVRMTSGLPWLPLSPTRLQHLLASSHNMHLRLLRVDAPCSQILGHTTLSGTLTLDRVGVDDPHVFLAELSQSDHDAGPTRLIIRRPYNVWTNLWTMLATTTRLTAFELQDDIHHPLLLNMGTNNNQNTASGLPQLSRTIESLHLNYFTFTLSEWQGLWLALQHHPAMTATYLGQENTLPDDDIVMTNTHHREQRSHVVAQSIWVNRLLQQLYIAPEEVDPGIWQTRIAPCMERNLFGPRFEALAAAGGGRANVRTGSSDESLEYAAGQLGLFGKAVQRLKNTPRLLFQYLNQNSGTLAQALNCGRNDI